MHAATPPSTGERLDAFFGEQADGLCHRDFWRTVAAIWREADAAGRRDPRWTAIWERAALAPGAQQGLMDDAERAAYAQLPAAERDRTLALLMVDGEPELVVRPSGAR